MAFAFLDGETVDRISAEARSIHFGRSLLVVLASLLFAVGWVVAKVFAVGWLVAAWTFAAVKVGWQEGRRSSAVSRS